MSVPLSLELAKAHLRVGDDTSLDGLIEQYLEMAFAIAEDYTNRNLRQEFSAESLPASIRAAILLILGTLFDNEADVLVGRSATELPLTAEKLLQPWRIHPYGETTITPPKGTTFRVVKQGTTTTPRCLTTE